MLEDFKKLKLIIGLGNPGKNYIDTYHNIGHLFVNYLKYRPLNRGCRLLKSDAYMNSSGAFVKKALIKHKVKPTNILIVHDDSDINVGSYKISINRGSAGHKGIQNIIDALKTKNFARLRIGVRRQRPSAIVNRRRMKAGEFVLKKITAQDKKIFEATFNEILSYLKTHTKTD